MFVLLTLLMPIGALKILLLTLRVIDRTADRVPPFPYNRVPKGSNRLVLEKFWQFWIKILNIIIILCLLLCTHNPSLYR